MAHPQLGQIEELAQHPVANVGEIGRTGPEIQILGDFISGDLLRHGLSPRHVRGHAAVDRGIGALSQGIILEQRHLKADDVGGFALEAPGQGCDSLQGGGDRVRQRLFFSCDAPLCAPELTDRAKRHRRPEGEPGRGGETR